MRSSRSVAWLAPLALLGCGRPVPGQLPAAPRADAVPTVQPATSDQIATALAFKADVGQLDQLSGRKGVGPVSASSAPPPDLLARTLPRALTLDQAKQLLITVPAADVETGLGDRHVNFLAPFWGPSYLDGFAPFGIGPLSYFPFSIFTALNFFPYAYGPSVFFYPYAFDAGLFYPSFCPFYFGASAFLPYCQPPLVYYGTGVPVVPGLPPVVPPVAAGMPPIGPGMPPIGAGMPPIGAGMPPIDAGMPPIDAGMPPIGAGVPPIDAGMPPIGAGMPPIDAGMAPIGAGVPPMPSSLDGALPAAAPPVDGTVAPPVVPPDIPPVAPPVVPPVGALGPVPPVIPPIAPLGPVPPALPVTVAEGMRPLLYFPGEVPVL